MKQTLIVMMLAMLSNRASAQANTFNSFSPQFFQVAQYSGTIGKSAMVMVLEFYPDGDITGYYYYKRIGQLLSIEKRRNYPGTCLEGKSLDARDVHDDGELFQFNDTSIIDKKTLNGYWTFGQTILEITVKQDTVFHNWRLLERKSKFYDRSSYFSTQTTDQVITFPTKKSFPALNISILSGNEFTQELINFINSTKSSSLVIDENFGEEASNNDIECWSMNAQSQLAYLSDSIVTIKTSGFTYCNNGYSDEGYSSFRVSSGEQLTLLRVFRPEAVDTVLSILKTKYADILQQNEQDPNEPTGGSDAPYAKAYRTDTQFFIGPSGVYFSERLFKLAPYYNLFLSFKEIAPFLSDEFIRTIRYR